MLSISDYCFLTWNSSHELQRFVSAPLKMFQANNWAINLHQLVSSMFPKTSWLSHWCLTISALACHLVESSHSTKLHHVPQRERLGPGTTVPQVFDIIHNKRLVMCLLEECKGKVPVVPPWEYTKTTCYRNSGLWFLKPIQFSSDWSRCPLHTTENNVHSLPILCTSSYGDSENPITRNSLPSVIYT